MQTVRNAHIGRQARAARDIPDISMFSTASTTSSNSGRISVSSAQQFMASWNSIAGQSTSTSSPSFSQSTPKS